MVRILLVDDEPFIVQGLKAMIELDNPKYRIVGEASDGKEALEFLKREKVDLIIADVQMPVMSGLELLETIRKEKFRTLTLWFSAGTVISSTRSRRCAMTALIMC